MLPLRYSASGPIIANGDGGEAVPGEGFQLRLADNFDSTGALVLSGVLQAMETPSGPFIVQLANPKPNLRYRARATFTLATDSANDAVFTFTAQWRVDGGFWSGSPPYQVEQDGAIVMSTACEYNSLLTLGADLPSPVLADSALLEVQFVASVSTAGTAIVAGNHIYGELIETL